jgi:hypothetical protein
MSKMSRTDYVRSRRKSSYAGLANGIRGGHIPCYLIEGKVFIDDEEADEYFRNKKKIRLVELYGPDLFIAQS